MTLQLQEPTKKQEENTKNNENNIEEEDEEDVPMPENFKKYNIDGVPKRRKSENLQSKNHKSEIDPEADPGNAQRGLGEKTLSKRRLQDNLSI